MIVVLIVAIVGAALFFGLLPLPFKTFFVHTVGQYSANVVNGIVFVPSGSYQSYQFMVPGGATNISVQGSFASSGGSGGYIEVFIMDQTNYGKFQNSSPASAIFDSGKVTAGTISAGPPGGGTYYLIYSNTFTTNASKTVQTSTTLDYLCCG